jgi:hypothetical protein
VPEPCTRNLIGNGIFTWQILAKDKQPRLLDFLEAAYLPTSRVQGDKAAFIIDKFAYLAGQLVDGLDDR